MQAHHMTSTLVVTTVDQHLPDEQASMVSVTPAKVVIVSASAV